MDIIVYRKNHNRVKVASYWLFSRKSSLVLPAIYLKWHGSIKPEDT